MGIHVLLALIVVIITTTYYYYCCYYFFFFSSSSSSFMIMMMIIIMRYHTLKGFYGLQFLCGASILQFLIPAFLISLFTTLVYLTLGLDAPLFPSGL
jgi:hypothetical protein